MNEGPVCVPKSLPATVTAASCGRVPLRMYAIEYASGAADDLERLRAYDRKRLLDRIEEQLSHQPLEETRNRKPIYGLRPPWEHEEPVWELRIGRYRVFYDVLESATLVIVRAIRYKPPHRTTEEIL